MKLINPFFSLGSYSVYELYNFQHFVSLKEAMPPVNIGMIIRIFYFGIVVCPTGLLPTGLSINSVKFAIFLQYLWDL